MKAVKAMSQRIDDYINTLLLNEVSVSELDRAKEILFSSDELMQILNSPSVSPEEKSRVVSEIFSSSVKPVVLGLAEKCRAESICEVIEAYSCLLYTSDAADE